MAPLFRLLPDMLESFLSLLTDVSFWLIVLLVGLMYKKMGRTSRRLFQISAEPVWRVTAVSALFGLAGGALGSVLLVLAGISLQEIGISYLWVTALLLMLIEQRFLCFAYAGGLLSLSHLILGFPAISVPQLMGLVAILHMIEALLIYGSGHLEPIPVYIRIQSGQIVGGFNLQKFWPLPLIAMSAWNIADLGVLTDSVQLPYSWWPLIKSELALAGGFIVYKLMPVVAALGYGDIAVSAAPREKTRTASWELACYSMILLLLSVAASHIPILAVLPALFGPLGHEMLIRFGQRRELHRRPLFVPPERGVMILHVLRGSPLYKAGLRTCDVLLSVNHTPVNDEMEIRQALLAQGERVELEYLTGKEKKRKTTIVKRAFGQMLGFIPVPGESSTNYLEIATSASFAEKWLRKIRKKFGR